MVGRALILFLIVGLTHGGVIVEEVLDDDISPRQIQFSAPVLTNKIDTTATSTERFPWMAGRRTGIPCSRPGYFVPAPDGCNRCFCGENGELTHQCTRVLCLSSGFPSGFGLRPLFFPFQQRNQTQRF